MEFHLRLERVLSRVRYASLSYCWGGDQVQKTTVKNVEARHCDVCYWVLPKTIQDAIITTHKLGLHYLWVDSLCIIQDSKTDVALEIQKMVDIYRGSYITISAATADHSNGGFLQSRIDIASEDPWYSLGVRQGRNVMGRLFLTPITPRMVHPDSPSDEPINERAWTLQESLLSPRVLYYSSRQVFWRCSAKPFSDGGLNIDYRRHDDCSEPRTLTTKFPHTDMW
jgi:hypothetical protein